MNIKIVLLEKEKERFADYAFYLYTEKSKEGISKKIEKDFLIERILVESFKKFFGNIVNIFDLSMEDKQDILNFFFDRLHKYQLQKNKEMKEKILASLH